MKYWNIYWNSHGDHKKKHIYQIGYPLTFPQMSTVLIYLVKYLNIYMANFTQTSLSPKAESYWLWWFLHLSSTLTVRLSFEMFLQLKCGTCSNVPIVPWPHNTAFTAVRSLRFSRDTTSCLAVGSFSVVVYCTLNDCGVSVSCPGSSLWTVHTYQLSYRECTYLSFSTTMKSKVLCVWFKLKFNDQTKIKDQIQKRSNSEVTVPRS